MKSLVTRWSTWTELRAAQLMQPKSTRMASLLFRPRDHLTSGPVSVPQPIGFSSVLALEGRRGLLAPLSRSFATWRDQNSDLDEFEAADFQPPTISNEDTVENLLTSLLEGDERFSSDEISKWSAALLSRQISTVEQLRTLFTQDPQDVGLTELGIPLSIRLKLKTALGFNTIAPRTFSQRDLRSPFGDNDRPYREKEFRGPSNPEGREGGFSRNRGSFGRERAPSDEQDVPKNRLFVTGLDHSVGWKELKDHFRQSGTPVFTAVFSRGSGVVEYHTEEAAAQALAELDGSELAGQKISVRVDRRLPPRKGRNSFGREERRSFSREPREPREPRPPKQYPPIEGRKVVVRNLSPSVAWQDLKDKFREVGKVVRADVDGSGSGTVIFETTEDAQTASSRFNNTRFGGTDIQVIVEH